MHPKAPWDVRLHLHFIVVCKSLFGFSSKFLHFGAKCREFTSEIWEAMAPGANSSVSLKDTALFAMSGWPEIRPDLPSFSLKIHGMQKTLAVTWTEEAFVVRRFVWKWLVGRIGAEEPPDLV